MSTEDAILDLQEKLATKYAGEFEKLLRFVPNSPLTESCLDTFHHFLQEATIAEMEKLHAELCTLVRGVNHTNDSQIERVVEGLAKLMIRLTYELVAKSFIKEAEAEARAAKRRKPFGLALPIVHKKKRWYKRLIRWIRKRLRSS